MPTDAAILGVPVVIVLDLKQHIDKLVVVAHLDARRQRFDSFALDGLQREVETGNSVPFGWIAVDRDGSRRGL